MLSCLKWAANPSVNMPSCTSLLMQPDMLLAARKYLILLQGCLDHVHWINKLSRDMTTALLLVLTLSSERHQAQDTMTGGCVQVAVSTVTQAERLLFRKLPYPGIYHCVARYGYRDRVRMDSMFVTKLLDKVCPLSCALALLQPLFMLCVLASSHCLLFSGLAGESCACES